MQGEELSLLVDRHPRRLNKQNDQGVKNVRGSYLDRFVKIDEDTYEVIFYTRTAADDELHVARYTTTLARDGSRGRRTRSGAAPRSLEAHRPGKSSRVKSPRGRRSAS